MKRLEVAVWLILGVLVLLAGIAIGHALRETARVSPGSGVEVWTPRGPVMIEAQP